MVICARLLMYISLELNRNSTSNNPSTKASIFTQIQTRVPIYDPPCLGTIKNNEINTKGVFNKQRSGHYYLTQVRF